MKSTDGASGVDLVLEALEMIWQPGMEAMRLHKELNVRSLGDTVGAAERAGCEVCYVDLPETVSGFATVIEGQPIIAVNRAKPRRDIPYTVSHELGHQVLHLSPTRHPDPAWIPLGQDVKEFQAMIFASMWVLKAPDSDEKKQLLEQNPESNMVTWAIFVSLAVIVFAVLGYLAAPLLPTLLPQPQTARS